MHYLVEVEILGIVVLVLHVVEVAVVVIALGRQILRNLCSTCTSRDVSWMIRLLLRALHEGIVDGTRSEKYVVLRTSRVTSLHTRTSGCFIALEGEAHISAARINGSLVHGLDHLAVVVLVVALVAAGKELPNAHANHHLLQGHTSPSPCLPLAFPLPLPCTLLRRFGIEADAFLGLVLGGDDSSLFCTEALNRNRVEGVFMIWHRCSNLIFLSPTKHFPSMASIWIDTNYNQGMANNMRRENSIYQPKYRSFPPAKACFRCCLQPQSIL